MYPIISNTPEQLIRPEAKAACVTMIGTFLIGTGSVYEISHAESWRHYLQPRVQFVVDADDSQSGLERPDLRTIAEHIENIRSVLIPSVANLAALFDVSRQAIYKWLSGNATPESEKVDRIIELSRIADAFATAGIERADTLLKMKTFNGHSLMELLKSGASCEEHIQTLIAEARVMKASYKQSGLAESKAKPTSDWRSNISIPGSSEHI